MIVAPTPAEVAVLTRASNAVPSSLTRLEIGPGPTGSGGGTETNWLNVTHAVETASVSQITDAWDGQAIAAAYQGSCTATGVPCLDGFSLSTANGDVNGDFAHPVHWTTVSTPPGSTQSLATAIRKNAALAGLTGVSVSFDSLNDNLFPIVDAIAADPAHFLQNDGPTAVFADLSFPATLLTIHDSGGSTAYAAGLSRAAGTGEAWVASKYENDAPHFGPAQLPN